MRQSSVYIFKGSAYKDSTDSHIHIYWLIIHVLSIDKTLHFGIKKSTTQENCYVKVGQQC